MSASSLFSVEHMVVVITGGATGIGLMLTKAFALNKAAKVYIVGRRKDKLDEAAKLSSNIVPVVGDVTSKQSLMDIAAQVQKEVGYVNLLICNSGTMPPGVNVKPGEVSVKEFAKANLDLNFEDWTTCYNTNTIALSFSTFAFLELLDAGNKKGNAPGRSSQVLVTSSIAGYLRVPGANIAYGGSKAAATHDVKHLASTLASYDVRVNALAPGLFPSDLAQGLISAVSTASDPSVEGSVDRKVIPAGRTGKDDDMVGTVLYMASKAASYLNGNILVIDGGRIGMLPSSY